MALGAFTGVVLSVVSGYEWAFVERMRKEGLVTLAKIRGIRKEKGIKTEKYYLQVMFSTPQQRVAFAETSIISDQGFKKGDTLSIVYLPSDPSQIIRKEILSHRTESLFFMISLVFTFLCGFFGWFLWKKNNNVKY